MDTHIYTYNLKFYNLFLLFFVVGIYQGLHPVAIDKYHAPVRAPIAAKGK